VLAAQKKERSEKGFVNVSGPLLVRFYRREGPILVDRSLLAWASRKDLSAYRSLWIFAASPNEKRKKEKEKVYFFYPNFYKSSFFLT